MESGLTNNEDNPDEENEFTIFQDSANKDLECSLQVLLDMYVPFYTQYISFPKIISSKILNMII